MRKGQITKAITRQLKEGRAEKAADAAQYGVFKITQAGTPAKRPLNVHRSHKEATTWKARAEDANPGKTFVILPAY